MNKAFNPRGQRGLTLVELIIAMAILAILAAAVLPMAEVTVKRTKELELRRALRTIRTAIDDYHADFLKAAYPEAGQPRRYTPAIDETGYPEELEDLVEGTDWGGLYQFKKKYLRRIPKDPFDKYDEGWGLRSYADEPDSTVYGGEDIYDVYSQSEETALDGTIYNTW
ncbi:type II secretion system pseudopilin PulG [Desulfuromonas versatilis]|uniref:Type II secretion system pseudopilin PulG n=1 Tax=Desulfuromonas versatilis TaxID=2802975 RepID=A0ABM8HUT7_9BACT|nr:prepilin-type N-terminal cleavage/methylation domain-containing protein [Desulfuromonas versatilis]BCR05763.1 type II secretion system pseudopilin PulG [Desulfuromonas versatilis]